VGFAGTFGSCRAIQGGILLLAMLVSYVLRPRSYLDVDVDKSLMIWAVGFSSRIPDFRY